MSATIPLNYEQGLQNVSIYCERFQWYSGREIWSGKNLFNFPLPVVFILVSILTFFRSIFELLLQPLVHLSFVPKILSGIALGPSFLGHNETFQKELLFAPKGLMVLDILQELGFIFHLFLLSVRLDITIIKRCGRMEIAIGLASFVIPLFLTTSIAEYVRNNVTLDDDELHRKLPILASVVSTTSFHAILAILKDLKLLNSELGRLALASSIISGMSSWVFVAVCFSFATVNSVFGSRQGIVLAQISKVVIILIIVFGFRPLILWMMRRTPDAKPLMESHIISISLMTLFCTLLGEVTGQHFFFGPIILGLATPDGPPVGSSLVAKIEGFVNAVLMPCYIIDVGRQVDLFRLKPAHFVIMGFLVFVSMVLKFTTIVLPSLYFKMPLADALSLSLLLNCKEFVDLQIYSSAHKVKLITDEGFTVLVITAILQTAIFTPLARLFYDPARRYVAYKRRTIQHTRPNTELRVLACVYQQDNVPAIISILEASSPTRESPFGIYMLNLKESVIGGTLPCLISHQFDEARSSRHNQMDHILKAFHQFQLQNKDLVMVQCFTSYAPYATMHDEICSMALERSTSIIIIPFNHSYGPEIRRVNRKVLETASCSVGILFDRGTLGRPVLSVQLVINICLVFIGGPDDRESLSWSERMIMHPNVRLTVLRLIETDQKANDLNDKIQDLNMVEEFRHFTSNSSNVLYREEKISEGTETSQLLGSICNDFQLILVGRRHNPDSSLLMGLSVWSEIEELGVIGDLLASSDFDCKASVLVVQQQASVVEEMIDGQTNIVMPEKEGLDSNPAQLCRC